MIEIITKDGVSLDLEPSAEFEIEIENPMFDDSHIPVPFSTAISFLPSTRNNSVFGYLNAMMLEPAVKTVDATIFSCGIPLMSGILTFDGIEDGMLNYTFSSTPKQEILSRFIHETPSLYAAFNADTLREVMDGQHITNHSLPLIVNAQKVADEDEDLKKAYGASGGTPVDVKYRNYYFGAVDVPIMPAVFVHTILKNLNIDTSMTKLQTLFKSIGILATYKGICDVNGFVITKNGDIAYDLADKLPECKVEDLLSNVLKIICGSIYVDGDRLLLMGNSEILSSSAYADWNDKVSDVYSLESEESRSYKLGFKEDATGNDNYIEDNPELIKVPAYSYMATEMKGNKYKAVERTDTGCAYSGKNPIYRFPKYLYVPFVDVIHRADVYSIGETENVCDMSSDFNLVKCIPVRTVAKNGDQLEYRDAMCPRVDFPPLDGSRPKEVYIGLISGNQFTDNGRIFRTTGGYFEYAFEENTGLSLLPNELYDSCHKPFAEWLAKEKTMISADVNLSEYDIHNFRIWDKVLIRSRLFVVKKLTVTISAASGHIACRGDFVSL